MECWKIRPVLLCVELYWSSLWGWVTQRMEHLSGPNRLLCGEMIIIASSDQVVRRAGCVWSQVPCSLCGELRSHHLIKSWGVRGASDPAACPTLRGALLVQSVRLGDSAYGASVWTQPVALWGDDHHRIIWSSRETGVVRLIPGALLSVWGAEVTSSDQVVRRAWYVWSQVPCSVWGAEVASSDQVWGVRGTFAGPRCLTTTNKPAWRRQHQKDPWLKERSTWRQKECDMEWSWICRVHKKW